MNNKTSFVHQLVVGTIKMELFSFVKGGYYDLAKEMELFLFVIQLFRFGAQTG